MEYVDFNLVVPRMNIKNILKWVSYFLLLPSLNGYATSVGVYQLIVAEKYINSPEVPITIIFYGDGVMGTGDVLKKWIPDSGAKYCGSNSRFRCIVGPMVLAYPTDSRIDSWCFAGVSYKKKRIDKRGDQRFFIQGWEDGKEGAQQSEATTSFVYDGLFGLDFIEYHGERYDLISRAGVMSDEFIAGASALLNSEELSILEDVCKSNEEVKTIVERASKF